MNKSSGQSLIELVVGIAIGVIFITGALGVVTLTLRLDLQNKIGQIGAELAQEQSEQVALVANADWHSLDSLTYDPESEYHLEDASGFLSPEVGSAPITLNGQDYTVFFTIDAVKRNDLGAIVTDGSGTTDPSTIKINSTVEWLDKGETAEVVFTRYLTRGRDRVADQNNWVSGITGSPGTGVTDFTDQFTDSDNVDFSVPGEIKILGLFESAPGGIYSNIDPTEPNHYAWNDVIGWIDFAITNNVYVTSTEVQGFANSSAVGFIALNCDSVPPGATDLCLPIGSSQFGVLNNANGEGAGKLSGMAWNDSLGWISFKDTVTPLTPSYQVTFDQVTGDFHGMAWSDVVGWISFNSADCDLNANTFTDIICGGNDDATTPVFDYKVKVNSGAPIDAELTSLIYDTQREGGVALNSILWQGTQPPGTRVRFLIATSDNLAGPWNFIGPSGDSVIYYEADANESVAISRALHNNKKYLRYKVFLYSDSDRMVTPTINSISLNWSL